MACSVFVGKRNDTYILYSFVPKTEFTVLKIKGITNKNHFLIQDLQFPDQTLLGFSLSNPPIDVSGPHTFFD